MPPSHAGSYLPGPTPSRTEEIVGSVLLLRRANGLAVTDEYLQALIDALVIPALTVSHRYSGLPAGIFSGHPTTQLASIPAAETSQEFS